jgi:predicted neutral ceramidase superfamily lipid hydrolase
MGRRNLNDFKRLGTHVIFISVLTIAAFIRISFDDSDMNTVIFGTVIAFGFILGLSIYNGMVISFSESFNDKLRVINYCMPTVPLVICFLIFDFPIETSDILILLTLILISNLAGYYFIERTKEETASR